MRYRLLLDSIQDGILILNAQTGIVEDVNACLLDMLGYSQGELQGQPLSDLEAFKATGADKLLLNVPRGEPEVRQESLLLRAKSGQLIQAEATGRIYSVGAGQLLHCNIHEVNTSRPTRALLVDTESIFHTFLAQTQDAIVLTDEDGTVIEWSIGAEKITGYTRAETMGQSLWDVQFRSAKEESRTASLRENIKAVLQPALRTGRGNFLEHPTEATLQRPDGSCIITQTLAFAVPTARGYLLGSLLRDVTAQRQAEEALRASEARFRGLFEEAPISLWEEDLSAVKQRLDALQSNGVTNLRAYLESHPEVVSECAAEMRVLDVNRATMNLFGANRKEQLLLSLEELLEGDLPPVFREELVAVGQGLTRFSWEGVNRTLDGGLINISLTWSVLPGYEDTFARVMVSMIDITARKVAEARIKALAKFPDEDPFPVLRLNENGMILYANDASRPVLEDWNATAGQLAPANWITMVTDVLATGTKQAVQRPIGTRRWSFDVVPIMETGYVNIYGRDITDHARAQESTQRQLARLSALREIDHFISSSLDLHLTLSELLRHLQRELGADAADILLLNNASLSLEYAAGFGFRGKAPERARVRLGQPHAGLVALNRQMIEIPNLQAESEENWQRSQLAAEDFMSYYGVPLVAKGNVKGVLEVYQRTMFTADREWLEFLELMAGQAALAIDNALLFGNLQQSNIDLTLAYDATIKGWSRAMDLRDKETEGHTLRVTETAMELAALFGIRDQELVGLRRGALLHDVGKMGVPDSILLKPGPLTPDEWEVMKRHPELAHEMLAPIPYLASALDIPYCHHEKWDGTGYPRGLKGPQIPLAARIFAIVDVWDALTSDRPYRPAWSNEEALAYIKEQAGKHFDPDLVRTSLASGVLGRRRSGPNRD